MTLPNKTFQDYTLQRGFAYLIVVVTLFLGYYANLWQSALPAALDGEYRELESYAIGGLVVARREGLFAHPILSGHVIGFESGESGWRWQYDAYFSQQRYASFSVYDRQAALQVWFMAAFDTVTDLSPVQALEIMRIVTAFTLALVIGLIVLWCASELGWLAGLLSYLASLLSVPLCLMGRNVFWALWALYVPLIACLAIMTHSSHCARLSGSKIFVTMWVAVMIKCLFSGYEFISTVLLMLFVPWVFAQVADTKPIRQGVAEALLLCGGAIAGVVTNMGIVVLLIAPARGGLLGAFQHLASRLTTRTIGVADANVTGIATDTIGLVVGYLNRTVIDAKFVPPISVLHLLGLFGLASFAIICHRYLAGPGSRLDRRAIAILTATWFSLAAPLSWLVLFKQHSIVHVLVNDVVWYMPVVPFGFAMCGRVLETWLGSWIHRIGLATGKRTEA